METIPDIIRGFRAADGEVLRIAGAEAEPFAAVDPRHLRVEAAAGASARIVVLHTAPDVSSLTLTLAEGAQLELTELFTAEAFAEVWVKQAAPIEALGRGEHGAVIPMGFLAAYTLFLLFITMASGRHKVYHGPR